MSLDDTASKNQTDLNVLLVFIPCHYHSLSQYIKLIVLLCVCVYRQSGTSLCVVIAERYDSTICKFFCCLFIVWLAVCCIIRVSVRYRSEWVVFNVHLTFDSHSRLFWFLGMCGNRISVWFWFLRASAMLKHVIDIGWTSVCLSVCPSVTRWHCIKTCLPLISMLLTTK